MASAEPTRPLFLQSLTDQEPDKTIAERLAKIYEDLLPYPDARLIAVSKFQPPAALEQAYKAGQRAFGENYVQEALEKIPRLPKDCAWHMIGPLQQNKIKHLPGNFHYFHALSSLKTAQTLYTKAKEKNSPISALIQMNLDQEDSKNGLTDQDQLKKLWEQLLPLQPHLQVVGLMTMPSPTISPEDTRQVYRKLYKLGQDCKQSYQLPKLELSMGMSHDYQIALAEGASMVRIGTSIFGSRPSTTS